MLAQTARPLENAGKYADAGYSPDASEYHDVQHTCQFLVARGPKLVA
jgi:hypothetical protein